jgi:hypothetical protein
MLGSSEDDVLCSTRSVKPQTRWDITSPRCRSATSNIASAGRYRFASPSAEEKLIYRNWRRAMLTLYAVIACATATILIATGSRDQSSTAKNGGCPFGVRSHCSERVPLVVNSPY